VPPPPPPPPLPFLSCLASVRASSFVFQYFKHPSEYKTTYRFLKPRLITPRGVRLFNHPSMHTPTVVAVVSEASPWVSMASVAVVVAPMLPVVDLRCTVLVRSVEYSSKTSSFSFMRCPLVFKILPPRLALVGNVQDVVPVTVFQ
jgi:hypothetical protein